MFCKNTKNKGEKYSGVLPINYVDFKRIKKKQ